MVLHGGEPGEEGVPGLQEAEGVAEKREGVGSGSVGVVMLDRMLLCEFLCA